MTARAKVEVPRKVIDQYVELIRVGYSKSDASRALNVSPAHMGRLVKSDPELVAAVEDAWAESADPMIEEARRRGVDGWEEPVFQQGKQVGSVRKYDSNLLMFSIKARRPEFKENPKVDITNQIGFKFDDRSAGLVEGLRVLAEAGIDPQGLTASLGSGGSVKELPVAEVVVAESSDV